MDHSHDRLVDAAVAALQGADGELQIVNLNKALFYFDLAMLRDFGRTYTNATYVALKLGPVVDDYQTVIVKELEARGLADQVDQGMAKPVRLRPEVRTRGMEFDALAAARVAGQWAAGRSAKQVSLFSHNNLGYQAAFRRGAGTPINMVLAMQQLIDVDAWTDAPWTEQEEEVIAAAESGPTEAF